ncbi:MAG: N-acetylmuramoyl-L-alanine amidase family protein, partial [Anaerotignaceae bacterium]
VNSIKIENDEYGNTRFVIEENDIIAHTIRDFGDEIHIQLVDPKDVYSKIVVLDAGHGGQDPGASANGLTEKTINLDIMLRVYNLLANDDNIKVYATRVDDTYPTNISRAQMGNEVGDLFISIHQNSATSSSAKGTEVLYTVHATDVAGKLTSQIAAQYVQNSLVNALGTTNRGIKNRADLIVLNQTTVPAILLEIGFLTNQDDANLLKNEDSKNVIANAIYSAIVAMMNENKVR